MRKKVMKGVSSLLVLAMMAVLLCVPSFATNEDSPNVYGIKKYVALGDSIATGLNDNSGTNQDSYGSWQAGYTCVLAKALNLYDESVETPVAGYNQKYYVTPNDSSFQSWAFPAMRTEEILNQVDASYDYEMDDFAKLWLDNGELNASLGDVGAMIREDIKDADLITLNVGSNDVLLSQLRITAWELDDPDNGLTSGMIVDLAKSKLGFGDEPNLPEGVDGNELMIKFVARFLPNVMKGYGEFLQNMPRILAAIREQNAQAQVVVLGIFNPLHYSFSLTDGKLPVSLGEMIDGVMLPMNLALAAFCARYSCTYVDVVDVRTDESMHPDNAGYIDIANRILEKLRPITNYSDTKNLSSENRLAVRWSETTENFEGISETRFSPSTLATRAQVISALYKMAGSPTVSGETSFRDVKQSADYAAAVQWAVENNITSGTSKNYFSPNLACTRKQVLTFLYNYDKLLGEAGSYVSYDDALTWASEKGISKGFSTVSLKTATVATRMQALLMIYRYSQIEET